MSKLTSCFADALTYFFLIPYGGCQSVHTISQALSQMRTRGRVSAYASFQMRAGGKRIEQLRARRTLTGGEPAGQRSPAQIQSRIWSKRVLMAEYGANVCSRHGDWRYLETAPEKHARKYHYIASRGSDRTGPYTHYKAHNMFAHQG